MHFAESKGEKIDKVTILIERKRSDEYASGRTGHKGTALDECKMLVFWDAIVCFVVFKKLIESFHVELVQGINVSSTRGRGLDHWDGLAHFWGQKNESGEETEREAQHGRDNKKEDKASNREFKYS